MAISMYQASVPVFTRMLGNLAAILEKGAVHAEGRNIDPAVLLETRLFPDMFPLKRQVQIATYMAQAGSARLAGLEPPKTEDTETSFAELIGRIERTQAFLATLTPEQIDGSEDRVINWMVRDTPMSLKGQAYLLDYVHPNFYFHVTTAYDILRHCGVELGKRDFLGRF